MRATAYEAEPVARRLTDEEFQVSGAAGRVRAAEDRLAPGEVGEGLDALGNIQPRAGGRSAGRLYRRQLVRGAGQKKVRAGVISGKARVFSLGPALSALPPTPEVPTDPIWHVYSPGVY